MILVTALMTNIYTRRNQVQPALSAMGRWYRKYKLNPNDRSFSGKRNRTLEAFSGSSFDN